MNFNYCGVWIDELTFLNMIRQFIHKPNEEMRKVINVIFRENFGFPKEVNYLMREVEK